MFCQRHNHYSLVDKCPDCSPVSSLLSNSDSSSDRLFGSTTDEPLYSYSPPKNPLSEKLNPISEMSANLGSALEKTKPLYDLPELPKPLYKPPEFPKPVKSPLGDMLGYREKDVLGRDTFRPVMGGGAYQVGPSVFGNSYVRDYRGNLVGQMSQGPLGNDTLLPPPDFGPSFR